MCWSEVRPWHAKYFWASRVGSPKIPRPLACPGLRSDRGMQSTFGNLGPATQNSKTPCMSWSEVRPWHAKYFWEFGASNPKFQNPLHVLVWGQTVACKHVFRNPPPRFMDFGFFRNLGHADITGQLISACHGLTSDQDMQGVWEFWVAGPKFPKVLCMPRSDLRPAHARGLGILGLPTLDSQNYRSDLRPGHARVWEFYVICPKFPKVLCMPRSDLRPGHAKGLGNFAGLVAFVLVNVCQQNIPWRIDNSYRQLRQLVYSDRGASCLTKSLVLGSVSVYVSWISEGSPIHIVGLSLTHCPRDKSNCHCFQWMFPWCKKECLLSVYLRVPFWALEIQP